MCCARLPVNAGPKKLTKIRHLGTIAQIGRHVFATKTHIDNRKKFVKQQYLLHMSLQYGELRPAIAAEIDPVVWGTPANFIIIIVLPLTVNKDYQFFAQAPKYMRQYFEAGAVLPYAWRRVD